MKVLDTTFLIDVLRGLPETKQIITGRNLLVTTQINVYEVMIGLFFKKVSAEKFLQAQELFEHLRVLSLDDNGILKSAQISAELMKCGEIIEDCDCLTAGIALSKGITTIVTRNKEHFQRVDGLLVETY